MKDYKHLAVKKKKFNAEFNLVLFMATTGWALALFLITNM